MSYTDREQYRKYQREYKIKNRVRLNAARNVKLQEHRAIRNSYRLNFIKCLRDGGYKFCHKCLSVKSVDDFTLSDRCEDGSLNHCKTCMFNYRKDWRTKNSEAIKIRKQISLVKQIAKDPISYKQTRTANAHRRRDRKINNGDVSYITKDVVKYIYEKYNSTCLCCGSKSKLSIDHIVPVTKGGLSTVDNLQLLCMLCNIRKSTKIIDYRGVILG